MGKALTGLTGLTEQVDFNDPLTILLAREGDEADDVHEMWTAGTHRCATCERERDVYTELEPNIDKYTSDDTYARRIH